jgi:hypothetical protein
VAAVPETQRVVAGLDDVAVMGATVEQRGGHLGIAEYARPFGEAQGGGDDDAGAFVELGEQKARWRQRPTEPGAVPAAVNRAEPPDR